MSRLTVTLSSVGMDRLRELALADWRPLRGQAEWLLERAIATEFAHLEREGKPLPPLPGDDQVGHAVA